MDFQSSPEHEALRGRIRDFCAQFPDAYWRETDRERAYPQAFVEALTEAGFLSILIPEEYGGLGLGVTEASIVLEEINRSGGNSAAFHAQMYLMGALLRHGSNAQKERWLPSIAQRRAAATGILGHRSGSRLRYHQYPHLRSARGLRIHRQRSQELDQPHRAIRPTSPVGTHDTPRSGRQADGGTQSVPD